MRYFKKAKIKSQKQKKERKDRINLLKNLNLFS
jgi:hypothetical protein